MQFCFADLEQQIVNSPSRQGGGRTYQEKIVNANYVINPKLEMNTIRERPFNLKGGVMVFCFVQKFFFGQHKS
jgi:hypothetical protein